MAEVNNHYKNKLNKSKESGELAIKITAGDAIASNEFVQLNYSWLLFIVRSKFSRSNNHEDIVQDAFMLVINKLQKGAIENPQTIMAYLRTAAIHIGFEYLRKDKKFASAIDQELLDVIADSQNDILSNIIWNDKSKFVKQVLNELKIQRDKDILIKFYYDDESKTSICHQLNLSSEHFDRVLYRARQRLKQLIDNKRKPPNDDGKPLKTQKHKSSPNKNTNKNESHNFMPKIIEYIRYHSVYLLIYLNIQKTPKHGGI